MKIGIDFGTTNTVVSLMKDGQHQILKVGRRDGQKTTLMKSLLYFPEQGGGPLFDDAALSAYIEDPEHGRFLRSIKKLLPQKSFEQTRIYKKRFNAVDLIALFLSEVHNRIKEETKLSRLPPIDISRPVSFSKDSEIDAMAEDRLIQAYKMAGFEINSITVESESASRSINLTHKTLEYQDIALIDLGGGTTDISFISKRAENRYQIKANSGVYVGGDSIDSSIMNEQIVPLLGKGSRYILPFDNKYVAIPAYIWRSLSSWYDISFLARGEAVRFLKSVLVSAEAPDQIAQLITLIEDNLGLELFQEIERVKIALSSEARARFTFEEPPISISFTQERRMIEAIIDDLFVEIRGALDEARDAARRDVDAIALTGGTSQIPAVRAALRAYFGGRAAVIDLDPYHAVALGLVAA
ncbi:Hsp70 family protein [Myxococcota bacterium]|nr:Hsp70 family protein [Myxococcota bacterium]MBU1433132.1 Hsp70 family protein [Myxococcota bacterium]